MIYQRFTRPAAWIALACVITTSAIHGGGMVQLQRERSELRDRTEQLLATIDQLRSTIHLLESSDRAIERAARKELGLVRRGEVVYRFPTAPGDGKVLRGAQGSTVSHPLR